MDLEVSKKRGVSERMPEEYKKELEKEPKEVEKEIEEVKAE